MRRVAVLRSVENGVPMARTARDGLLHFNAAMGASYPPRARAGGSGVIRKFATWRKRRRDVLRPHRRRTRWICISIGHLDLRVVIPEKKKRGVNADPLPFRYAHARRLARQGRGRAIELCE